MGQTMASKVIEHFDVVADENQFMEDILYIHADPNALLDLDFQSLFILIKKVALRSTEILDGVVDSKAQSCGQAAIMPLMEGLNFPSSTINQVSWEITCKALHSKNVKATMKLLFTELSCYSWVSKAVLTLSAFALYYAEFWHSALTQSSNEVTKYMAILKGVPSISKLLGGSNSQLFYLFNGMFKTIVDMTECIVNIEQDSKNMPVLNIRRDIPSFVCKIVKAILWCSIHFSSIINGFEEFKEEDLTKFDEEVKETYHCIKKVYDDFEQKKEEITQRRRLQLIFNAPTHIVELIKAFFYSRDSLGPLFIGSRKATDKVESLRRKNVLLLISDMTLSRNDLNKLLNIYEQPRFRKEQYEIVWMPLVDDEPTEKDLSSFKRLQDQMPWYSPKDLTRINRSVISIVREMWYFHQESIVVVLDKNGSTMNQNAMNLIRIWGWDAFPFTESMATTLWARSKISWLELLVTDVICPKISEAIKEGKYIFLYGGGDPEVVQEIEENKKKISSEGASVEFIKVENTSIFLTQLESCLLLKQQTKADFKDPIMQEILHLYTRFQRDGGFMVLSHGSEVVINSSLSVMSMVLDNYSSWEDKLVDKKTFHVAMKEYHDNLLRKHQCYHVSVPNVVGQTTKNVKCPECCCEMKSILTFKCCHEAH